MNPNQFTLAATTNELAQETRVREVADVVEFRMDKAETPVAQVAEYTGELPILATNRGRWFGGQASDTGRLDQLFAASEFKTVEAVDIELETVRGTGWVVQEFRANDVDVVVSVHDFEQTPDVETLVAIFEECAGHGDVAKVATYANERADSLRMLEAIETATSRGIRVAGISMGGVGSHTRAVAPLYGSELGYAPLHSDTSEYAPGQIPIRELDSLVTTLNRFDTGRCEPSPDQPQETTQSKR